MGFHDYKPHDTRFIFFVMIIMTIGFLVAIDLLVGSGTILEFTASH